MNRKIEIDVTEIRLLGYACQEMAYRRTENALNSNDPMARRNWLVEADQYRVMAERFYAFCRDPQLTA